MVRLRMVAAWGEVVKACIACMHLYAEEGSGAVDPAFFERDKIFCEARSRHFDIGPYLQEQMLEAAEDCPHFQISDLAKSKGWPE